ncbi:M14 family zinc carboxypeptidase [Desulfobacterota bacterium M19]
MKKSLLPALLLGIAGLIWPAVSLAWGNSGSWESWGGMKDKASWRAGENHNGSRKEDNEAGRWSKKEAGKKYCSMSREKGLLKLLRQLNQPFSSIKTMRGGLSEARWKYNMIMKLRKYDDCRAEDALRMLSKENICEERGEGDVFCVKWAADSALQEAKARADLKKLAPGTPVKEQLKIIRKYTKQPYKNDFAVNAIAHYLDKESSSRPQTFLPLLVELFPQRPETEDLARRYPEPADKGLKKLLSATDINQVWWGITLARYLRKTVFMERIYNISFAGKGNIDYTDKSKTASIQTAAKNYFRALRPESLPYIKRAAGSKATFAYCSSAAKGCKTSLMINRYLNDLAANADGYAVTRSIGRTSGANGNGSDSREIRAILITENASWLNDHGKPTVIITGAIHGNEWATPEVCLGIAEYLLENKDNSAPATDDMGALINQEAPQAAAGIKPDTPIVPRITNVRNLLKTIQIIIIPVLNPDGYDFSHTAAGKKSYYGAGWRPNRRNTALTDKKEICYRRDGTPYAAPPAGIEHCFLADYDASDAGDGSDLSEEEVMVCESVDQKTLRLFDSSLNVSSDKMFEAIYSSTNPARVVCASGQKRVWKEKWTADNDNAAVKRTTAVADGYIQNSHGVDINRNFQYQWDVVKNQENLFIRSRSPSSRVYRGRAMASEQETRAMERLIAQKNVVALIDYHSGSTQVLYPYAYSTRQLPDRNLLQSRWGEKDYQVFRQIADKIAALLNRHDRSDKSIVGYTAAQNYNDTNVASGVARDCYYQTEGIAALNIEVHDRRYTYEHEEFKKIVPEICKTNVPGAIWFLFWAAELKTR